MEGLSAIPFFGIIAVIAAFFLIMFFTYKALYKKAPADAGTGHFRVVKIRVSSLVVKSLIH